MECEVDALALKLKFECTDIDYVFSSVDKEAFPELSYYSNDWLPIIRMFGLTATGDSVCTFVNGFLPYFYVPVPKEVVEEGMASVEEVAHRLRRGLELKLRDPLRDGPKPLRNLAWNIKRLKERIQKMENPEEEEEFQTDNTDYIMPHLIKQEPIDYYSQQQQQNNNGGDPFDDTAENNLFREEQFKNYAPEDNDPFSESQSNWRPSPPPKRERYMSWQEREAMETIEDVEERLQELELEFEEMLQSEEFCEHDGDSPFDHTIHWKCHVHDVSWSKRTDVFGYNCDPRWFYKVQLYKPQNVSSIRSWFVLDRKFGESEVSFLERSMTWGPFMLGSEEGDDDDDEKPVTFTEAKVFEANVDFVLRYMIDSGMHSFTWIEATASSEELIIDNRTRPFDNTNYRYDCKTLCDLETSVYIDDIKELTSVKEHAPVQVLSFDIEVDTPDNVFPSPFNDYNKVIMIAALVQTLTGMDHRSEAKHAKIFTWKSCGNILTDWIETGMEEKENREEEHRILSEILRMEPALRPSQEKRLRNKKERIKEREGRLKLLKQVEIVQCRDEEDMLLQFREYFVTCDPDIYTGYNIPFDMSYMLRRGEHLQLPDHYFVWGRIQDFKSKVTSRFLESKAFGKREVFDFKTPGRVLMCMLEVLRRDHKLRSYKLGAVAKHFLQLNKLEVPYRHIHPMWNGLDPKTQEDEGDKARLRLAVYNFVDALLPLRLMMKLKKLTNAAAMCRVTGVPLQMIMNRGQQIKVFSQLLWECRAQGYVIPYVPQSREEDPYEGAHVFEPIRGFYDSEVACLDFSSLYPSIMIVWNLCYSTYIRPEDVDKWKEDDYFKSPAGHCFLKPHIRKGVLPEMLKKLLAERKIEKKLMQCAEEEKRMDAHAVHDGQQNALKVTANSTYGFTGVSYGKLPLKAISESVTAYGRESILKSAYWVENVHPKGHPMNPYGNKVIYGDTDSIMYDLLIPKTESIPLEVCKPVDDSDLHEGWMWMPREKDTDRHIHKQSGVYNPYKQAPDANIEIEEMPDEEVASNAHSDWDFVMITPSTEPAEIENHRMRVLYAMQLGQKWAKLITKMFGNGLNLAFEKIMSPFLLVNKKRYAAYKWEDIQKSAVLMVKGIESVRRDNAPICAQTIDRILKLLLVDRDIQGMLGFIRETINRLRNNQIDLDQLIISKQYAKHEDEYVSEQPHTALIRRMKKNPKPLKDERPAPKKTKKTKKKQVKTGKSSMYAFIKSTAAAAAPSTSSTPLYPEPETTTTIGFTKKHKRITDFFAFEKDPQKTTTVEGDNNDQYDTSNDIDNRTAQGIPEIGDRVPYVIIKKPGDKLPVARRPKICDKSEDPEWVRNHPQSCKPDSTYYLEKQLNKPWSRLVDPVMKKPGYLGSMIHRIIATGSNTGGIDKYITPEDDDPKNVYLTCFQQGDFNDVMELDEDEVDNLSSSLKHVTISAFLSAQYAKRSAGVLINEFEDAVTNGVPVGDEDPYEFTGVLSY